jgi:diketogulonate reductase-like aldo/keto reductase
MLEQIAQCLSVLKGLIRYVGVSNFSVEQIKQARDTVEIVSVQNHKKCKISIANFLYKKWFLSYIDQKALIFFLIG